MWPVQVAVADTTISGNDSIKVYGWLIAEGFVKVVFFSLLFKPLIVIFNGKDVFVEAGRLCKRKQL